MHSVVCPLLACFSENGPVNCLHKTPSLLHKKQMLRKPSLLGCLCINVFWPDRFVANVQIKPALRGWSNLCCQHRWDFLDRRRCLPDWLSVSVSQRDPGHHSHVRRRECSFGAAKLFASILLNFDSDRNTRVDRLGSVFSGTLDTQDAH